MNWLQYLLVIKFVWVASTSAKNTFVKVNRTTRITWNIVLWTIYWNVKIKFSKYWTSQYNWICWKAFAHFCRPSMFWRNVFLHLSNKFYNFYPFISTSLRGGSSIWYELWNWMLFPSSLLPIFKRLSSSLHSFEATVRWQWRSYQFAKQTLKYSNIKCQFSMYRERSFLNVKNKAFANISKQKVNRLIGSILTVK